MNLILRELLGDYVQKPILFMGGAVGLGLLLGAIIFFTEGFLWPLVLLVGVFLLWVVWNYPNLALGLLVFVTYTRASDIWEEQTGAPSFVLPLALLLLGVMAIRWWFLRQEVHDWERPALLIGAYGLVIFASLLYAAEPARSQNALFEYVKNAFLLMVVVLSLRNKKSLRAVIWSLLAAGIFMGTLTVYQQLTGTFANDYWGFAQTEVKNIVGNVNDHRVAGPVGAPNFYAMILVALVPLALDRLWHEKRWSYRLLALWAVTVCGLSIIFTFSRGGFLAFVVVLGLMGIRMSIRPFTLFVSALLLLLLLPFVPANYTERLRTTLDLLPGVGSDIRNESSFRGRTSEVLVAWQIFADHPIQGIGVNNYKSFYQEYAQPLGWDDRREERSAHSLYLEIAAESGLLGLATFGAIIGAAFFGLHRTRQILMRQGAYDDAYIIWALAVALIGVLVASIFLHGAYPRYLWLLIGIVLGTPQITRPLPTATLIPLALPAADPERSWSMRRKYAE